MAIAVRGIGTWADSYTASQSVDKHVDTVDDDLMVLFAVVNHSDSVSPLTITEAGWTETVIYDAAGTNKSLLIATKRASSETGSYTVTLGGARRTAVVIVSLSGVDGVAAGGLDATTVSTSGQTDSTTHDPGAIVTNTNGAWVLVGMTAMVSGTPTLPTTLPTGYTLLEERNPVSGFYGGLCYKEVATADTENPSTWGPFNASSDHCSATLAIKPAAAAGTTIPIFSHYYNLQKRR